MVRWGPLGYPFVSNGGREGAGEPDRPYPMSDAFPIRGAFEAKLEFDMADDAFRLGTGRFWSNLFNSKPGRAGWPPLGVPGLLE